MVKEKKSLEEKNQSFKDSDFVQDGDRANLSTYSSWSWDLVWHKGYAGKYFVIFLIILGISIVAGLLDGLLSYAFGLDSDHSFSLFSDIAGVVLSVGLIGVSINIAKGLVQKIGDFFREITWNRVWKVFCVSIVIGIIMVFCSAIFIASLISSESGVNILLLVLGIILLACGIFVGLRLNFAQYAVVDKGYGPKEALVYSRNITKGHFWEIVLFSLYFVAINLLGMLCVFVGLVWTVPMTYLATSKYYRMLSEIYDNGSKKK